MHSWRFSLLQTALTQREVIFRRTTLVGVALQQDVLIAVLLRNSLCARTTG